MTVPKRLRVELTLPIDPPRPFTADNKGNPEAIATEVWWMRTITEGCDHTYVTAFAEDGLNCSTTRSTRPPTGCRDPPHPGTRSSPSWLPGAGMTGTPSPVTVWGVRYT